MTDAQILDSAHEQRINLGIICLLLGNPKSRISEKNLSDIIKEMIHRINKSVTIQSKNYGKLLKTGETQKEGYDETRNN
jgi:hypothetical protein